VATDDETIYDRCAKMKFESDKFDALLEELEMLDFHNNIACRFFNFSWEALKNFTGRKHPQHETNLVEAERIATNTEILVVIGYSFPIFNREIDNRLFRKMDNLKKVYIQDKQPENIKSTMQNAFEVFQRKKTVNMFGNEVTPSGSLVDIQLADKVSFHLESNTNQFVIPYELTSE
jgi:hypothetical protein